MHKLAALVFEILVLDQHSGKYLQVYHWIHSKSLPQDGQIFHPIPKKIFESIFKAKKSYSYLIKGFISSLATDLGGFETSVCFGINLTELIF